MQIVQTYQDNLATGVSAVYKPANGTVLTFTELEVGTQNRLNSSFKVALYWDQQGNGQNLVPIHQVYTKNKSYKVVLANQQSFTATKNSRVIARRHIFGSLGQRQTYVRWVANVG